MSDAEHRLVAYGSLLPGEVNHHELEGAGQGHWQPCVVRAKAGMVGPWRVIELANDAPMIEAQLLTSPLLPQIWAGLDAFEGQAYKRVLCVADTAEGPLEAYVYVASGLPAEDA